MQVAEQKLEKEDLPELKQHAETLLNEYLSEKKGLKTIDGFRFEDAEREEFFKSLPSFTEKKMVTIEDGRKVIASEADMLFNKIMSDPKNSNAILPWLWLIKQGKLEGFSSDLIEAVKDKALEQLSSEPDTSGGEPGDRGYSPDTFIEESQK